MLLFNSLYKFVIFFELSHEVIIQVNVIVLLLYNSIYKINHKFTFLIILLVLMINQEIQFYYMHFYEYDNELY